MHYTRFAAGDVQGHRDAPASKATTSRSWIALLTRFCFAVDLAVRRGNVRVLHRLPVRHFRGGELLVEGKSRLRALAGRRRLGPTDRRATLGHLEILPLKR